MSDPLFFTPAAQAVAGLLLLLMGQRLFWVFVAVVGFFIGVQVGAVFFSRLGDFELLLLALVVGVAGALLAVLLQRLAVTLTGALAGGLLAMRLAPLMGLHTEAGLLVAFVAGALLIGVLLTVLFDPVLIVLSSLVGAVMITEAVPMEAILAPFVLIALTVVGILLQARRLPARAG